MLLLDIACGSRVDIFFLLRSIVVMEVMLYAEYSRAE